MSGLLGVWVQQSQHAFLGIPQDMAQVDTLSILQAWALEGLQFILAVIYIIFDYVVRNIIALAVFVGVIGLVVYVSRRPLRRLYNDGILVAIVLMLFVGAVTKLVLYDIPTIYINDVLRTYCLDSSYFDAPPLVASRLDTIWSDVVCSRIANSGTEFSTQACSDGDAAFYRRRVSGRFLVDATVTTVIALGEMAIGAYTLLRWRRLKHGALPAPIVILVVTGLTIAIAVNGLAIAFSRTARSTSFPYHCLDDCAFLICSGKGNCVDYAAATGFRPARLGGRTEERDVLQAHFAELLRTNEVPPPKPPMKRR